MKFEVVEVLAQAQGNHVSASYRTVAICATPEAAQADFLARGTAAFIAAQGGAIGIKAYMVRPIEIDLPGFE